MPSFASQEYWDTRFERDGQPFDWLIPAKTLRDITKDTLYQDTLRKSDILHIGCGTSDSSVLRDLVDRPEQVHNVDYSESGVKAARSREKEVLTKNEDLLETAENKHDSVQQPDPDMDPAPTPPACMRWSCMDLLSLQSTLGLLHHQVEKGKLYDVVLDKSTSDSISCGSDLSVNLPYQLSINGWTRRILYSGSEQRFPIHPLHILALHLAALTAPGRGRWIAISYSEERFPFLPPFPTSSDHGSLSDEIIKAGFAHPGQLWKLERKERIEVGAEEEEEETLAERKKRLQRGEVRVHRPKTSHWLYVLKRTDAVVKD